MDHSIKPEGQTTSDNFSLSDNQNNVSSEPQSDWGELNFDDKQYIGKKGIKTPADLLKSYRELEKSYSAKISLPKDGDEKALAKFYSHLGMPDNTNDYVLKFNGDDEPLKEAFKQVCFDNHILPKSAQALYDWFVTNRDVEMKKEEQSWLDHSTREAEEQISLWGAQSDKNLELMKRGIRVFAEEGDDESVNAIEKALGTKRMMNVFCRLGEAVSEDNPVSFGGKSAPKEFDAVAYYDSLFKR